MTTDPVKIPRARMNEFARWLAQYGTVYGVRPKEAHYSFEKADGFTDPGERYTAAINAPKRFFFPPSETLLRFKARAGAQAEAIVEAEPVVLLGVRPCDLAAVQLMDTVFSHDDYDVNYMEKRKQSRIVGIDCNGPCATETAFCFDLGTINVRGGCDLLLTDLGDAFWAAAYTEAGREIVAESAMFDKVTKHDEKMFERLRQKRDKIFKRKLPTETANLPLLFQEAFKHPVWEEEGARCLGCGSCVMVCPTCFCFDVYDHVDPDGKGGGRHRDWDGCVLRDFTLLASGEVFRERKAARLIHRWNRKFNYLMTRFKEAFCVGCGRCAHACLVNIDPINIVNRLAEKPKEVEAK